MQRASGLEDHPKAGMGVVLVGVYAPLMQRSWRWQKRSTGASTQLCPVCSSHHQQDKCMRELCQAHCHASLQNVTRSSLRGQRCSCSHSASQTWSLPARLWGEELAKFLKEDAPAAWSGLRYHSQGRNRLRWHQSPSPSWQSQCQYCTLALHNPVPMSGSFAPWIISTYKQDPTNPGAGHGKMMPLHWLEKKPEERSQVQNEQEVGWSSHFAPRPDPLLSGGCDHRVR